MMKILKINYDQLILLKESHENYSSLDEFLLQRSLIRSKKISESNKGRKLSNGSGIKINTPYGIFNTKKECQSSVGITRNVLDKYLIDPLNTEWTYL